MPRITESRLTGGHLLKNTVGRIELTVYVDGTATATDNDPTTPTVTVTRADGTALASAQSTTADGTGVYYYELTPTQCNRVDTLTVALVGTWGGTEQTFTHTVEVRGAHLFTLAEARSFDSSAMSNTSTYPALAILEERERITELLESWTNVSWVPRHYRATFPGTGGRDIRADHWQVTELIAASIGGTSVTVSDVTLSQEAGILHHETGVWTAGTPSNPRNVVLEYQHGYDRAYGVTRIALLLLRDRLVKSAVPEGALSSVGDFGSISYVQAGGPMGNVSRLPEVNQWVNDHAWRPPVYV